MEITCPNCGAKIEAEKEKINTWGLIVAQRDIEGKTCNTCKKYKKCEVLNKDIKCEYVISKKAKILQRKIDKLERWLY